MPVDDNHRRIIEKAANDNTWTLGKSANWQERLAEDPRSALRTLRQLYGKSPGKSPGTESVYWRAVLKHASLAEVAEAILQRFDPAKAQVTRLLAIDQSECQALFEHLHQLALGLLDRAEDVEEGDRQEALDANPVLLGEIALEEQGLTREAAAYYAVAHDLEYNVTPEHRFQRLHLCFVLCRALIPEGGSPGKDSRALVAFSRRVLESDAIFELPKEARRLLKLSFHEWIGVQEINLRDFRAAAVAFQIAAQCAGERDEKVRFTLESVGALVALGELQEALSEMQEMEGHAAKVQDRATAGRWNLEYAKLRSRLTGSAVDPSQKQALLDEDPLLGIGGIWEGRLSGSVPLTETAQKTESNLRILLGGAPPSDAARRHALLLQLAMLRLDAGQPEEATVLVEEAGALEANFSDKKAIRQRLLLHAQMLARAGQAGKAEEIFDRFVGDQESDEDELQFLGQFFYILLEGKAPAKVEKLAVRLLSTYERLLRAQPGAGARRYVLRVHSKVFETAIMALVSSAERAGVAGIVGQKCLAKCWLVLEAVRNPELHWKSPGPVEKEHAIRLRQLEAAFHAQIRRSFLDNRKEYWEKALSELHDFEAAVVQDLKLPSQLGKGLPASGISIAYLEVKALFRSTQLLVVGHYKGVFSFKLNGPLLHKRLSEWRDGFLAKALDIPFQGGGEKLPISIEDILPDDLHAFVRRFPSSPFDSIGDEAGASEPLESVPWYVFPSGFIHSLPLEILTEQSPHQDYFGSNRTLHFCLRSLPPPSDLLDLGGGWLGLGGVPGVPGGQEGFSELLGARDEIYAISGWLKGLGHTRVESLMGPEANAANLRLRLGTDPLAILHMAMHGTKNEEYAEACALILAPTLGRPEADLLPFRQIRELPCEGIELVVLSACSSLIGRSDASAGMEGLAWGFLLAGAKQVVATRYPVNDRAASVFMTVFYQQLRHYSPAEALGRTRNVCLRQGLVNTEIAAWSLWS